MSQKHGNRKHLQKIKNSLGIVNFYFFPLKPDLNINSDLGSQTHLCKGLDSKYFQHSGSHVVSTQLFSSSINEQKQAEIIHK